VPLLNVGPDGFAWNGSDGQREEQASADRVVAADVELGSIERERCRTFERFAIRFVAVGVFEEDAVTATNGHLAIALWIPSEADAGSGIEQVAFHAASFVVGADCCGRKLAGD